MKSKIKNILIVLIVIGLIILAGFGVKKYFNKEKKENHQVDVEEKTSEIVMLDKLHINIPEEYEWSFTKNENEFVLVSKDSEWTAYIQLYKDVKRDIYVDYLDIQDELVKAGYDVRNAKVTSISNTSVLLMEYYKGEYVGLIAHMLFEKNYAFEITLYNDDKSLESGPLSEIIKILNNTRITDAVD